MVATADQHRAMNYWRYYGENGRGYRHGRATLDRLYLWAEHPRARKRWLAHIPRSAIVQWTRGGLWAHLWVRTWCSGSTYRADPVLGDVPPAEAVICERCVLNHELALRR